MEELRVAALRVGRVGDGGAVPGAEAFGEDPHVVAVEVHGVGVRDVVVEDYAYGGVGAGVVEVPFWEGGVDFVFVGE